MKQDATFLRFLEKKRSNQNQSLGIVMNRVYNPNLTKKNSHNRGGDEHEPRLTIQVFPLFHCSRAHTIAYTTRLRAQYPEESGHGVQLLVQIVHF
jgi:hypothetical protein